MSKNLYEKFGGKQGIGTVVDRFYEKVLADPSINHFFTKTDMEAQRRHQTAFLSFALGGPGYSGRSMEEAHRGMNLQPEHFDAVARHLVESLRESGVEEGDIGAVVDRVQTLRDAVLYK